MYDSPTGILGKDLALILRTGQMLQEGLSTLSTTVLWTTHRPRNKEVLSLLEQQVTNKYTLYCNLSFPSMKQAVKCAVYGSSEL